MAWFKVDDAFHSSKPVMRIPRRYRAQAVGLWILAGTWSAQEESDGFVPEFVLEELCGTPAIASHLVRAGLWVEVTGESQEGSTVSKRSSAISDDHGWKFKNWGKYQPTRAQLEENREKERERKARYRMSQRDTEGTTEGQTEGHHPESNHPDPTRPDPTNKEEPSSEIADAIPRPEVLSLLDLLDAEIEKNGLKKPSRNKTNKDAMRLLVDRDGYTPEQIAWIIRWAAGNEFWRTNILSASKLREKFTQLMAKAGVGGPKVAGAGFNGDIDPDAILGKDYWQPPAPPEGLGIQEEIEWKRAKRAEHQTERLEEAKRRMEEQYAATV